MLVGRGATNAIASRSPHQHPTTRSHNGQTMKTRDGTTVCPQYPRRHHTPQRPQAGYTTPPGCFVRGTSASLGSGGGFKGSHGDSVGLNPTPPVQRTQASFKATRLFDLESVKPNGRRTSARLAQSDFSLAVESDGKTTPGPTTYKQHGQSDASFDPLAI